MKRGTVICVLLSIFMVGILNVPITVMNQGTPIAAVETPLIYGTIGLVVDLDPHFAWDSASINHINQVAEGLFAYNLGSSEGGIIPRLAAGCGTWNENATELTVPLRENVTFHDGTTFNASAVKWNFDRLNGFIERRETQIAILYKPLEPLYSDSTLLINETVVTGEFEVKIVLNYPYAALVALLCFSGSAILSPTATNETEFLHVGTDLLVGTGPYVHVSTTSEKTVFEAYPAYYRGTPAIQHMEWIEYEDTTMASTALLAHEIDLGDVSTDFLDDFEASADITVGQPMKGVVILYMWMRNDLIPKEHRQAISYAIDYDYIIDTLRDGNVARMISPVPEGIAYHNPNVHPATYNVTHARQIFIDAGLSHGLTADSSDQQWLDLVETDPIATYEYGYIYGNVFREELGILVKANCKAIGIKIDVIGIEWSAYIQWPYPEPFAMQMTGWGPYFNDPSNFIKPLFSNTSSSNGAQVNDPWLQAAMMDVLMDSNHTSRKAKYFAIQEYIVEDLMPYVFLYIGISQSVHADTISNWNRNPMRQLDFFSATFHGEDTLINDPLQTTSCGFEAPWNYYDPPERPETPIPPVLPDYRPLVILSMGFSLMAVVSIPFKHLKNPLLKVSSKGGYGEDFGNVTMGEDLSQEFFTGGDDQS